MSLRVPRPFEAPRGAVGGDDGCECSRGGDEEGFHGDGEGAKGVEAQVRAIDCCAALKFVSP